MNNTFLESLQKYVQGKTVKNIRIIQDITKFHDNRCFCAVREYLDSYGNGSLLIIEVYEDSKDNTTPEYIVLVSKGQVAFQYVLWPTFTTGINITSVTLDTTDNIFNFTDKHSQHHWRISFTKQTGQVYNSYLTVIKLHSLDKEITRLPCSYFDPLIQQLKELFNKDVTLDVKKQVMTLTSVTASATSKLKCTLHHKRPSATFEVVTSKGFNRPHNAPYCNISFFIQHITAAHLQRIELFLNIETRDYTAVISIYKHYLRHDIYVDHMLSELMQCLFKKDYFDFHIEFISNESEKEKFMSKVEKEMVDHPNHYTKGDIEVIEALELLNLPSTESSIIRYIARWRDKEKPVQDLNKAKWYITRLIALYKYEHNMPMTKEEEQVFNSKGIRTGVIHPKRLLKDFDNDKEQQENT